MSRDLDDLVDLRDRMAPGLSGQGAPAAPGISPHADDGPLIAQLLDCWQRRYPGAAPHYLALRCWGLLIWRLVYLSVFAARRSPIVPDPHSMDESVPPDGFVIGYTPDRHASLRGNLRERMQAATQPRNICAIFYRELTQVLRGSPRAAESMQADCVLNPWPRARALRPTTTWTREQASHCVSLLGIHGRSGYLAYERATLPLPSQARRQLLLHLPQI